MQRKNSRLLTFLDTDHWLGTRVLVSLLAFATVLAVTFSPLLAADAAGCALRRRNFKLTMRRVAWYVKFGWTRFTYLEDRFFNIAEGMGNRRRRALLRFVERRKSAMPRARYISEKLCILGALIDKDAARGVCDKRFHAAYAQCASDYLEMQMAAEGVSAAAVSEKKNLATPHDFNIGNATRALKDFADLVPLQEYGWFVMAGTFLGLFRERGFLPYELDIDLGLQIDPADRARFEALLQGSDLFDVQKIEFQKTVTVTGGHPEVWTRPVLIKLIHHTGVSFDVFYHYREGDVIWHGSAIHRWENSAFELKPYVLNGIDVLGPVDGDRYLAECYGNWEKSVPDFDYNLEMPNLYWAQNYTGVAYALKRLEALVACDNASIYQKALRRLEDGGYLSKNGAFIPHDTAAA